MVFQFKGELQTLITKVQSGEKEDVDYALSLIQPNSDGFGRIRFYLFNGTLIQRNYASLYLNRLGVAISKRGIRIRLNR